jgi:predicted TIM-barrel fold metal-dependent hydrolase
VIDERTSESDLDAMAAAGFCGVRLNLATDGHNDPALARRRFAAMLPRASARNWHIQIFTNLGVIAGIRDLVLASPVPVVLDHFGGARAALGTAQPGFADLLELVRSGEAYVKISGAYRASTMAPDYPDAAPLARALIAANPQRVVWGTDWPHTNSVTPPGRQVSEVTPLVAIDDGRLMNQLPIWAPDAATRKAILVDNPARLYGF